MLKESLNINIFRNKLLSTCILILIMLIVSQSSSFPQDKTISDLNFLSKRDFLGMEGMITLGYTDYKPLPGAGIKGVYEHYFSSFGYGLLGLGFDAGVNNLFGKDLRKNPDGFKTDMASVGTRLIYSYGFSESLSGNLSGGISYIWFNPMVEGGAKAPNNRSGAYKNYTVGYNFGGGFRFAITDMLSLNINAGIHYVTTDNLDDLSTGKYNDYFATGSAGISVAIFNRNEFASKVTPGSGIRHMDNKPNPDTTKKNVPIAATPGIVDTVFTTNINHPVRSDSAYAETMNKDLTGTPVKKSPQSGKNVTDLEKKVAELEKTVEELKTKVKQPEEEVAQEDKKVSELEKKIDKSQRKAERPADGESDPVRESPKERKGMVDNINVQMDITFLQDKTQIRPEAQPILDRIASYLKKHPNVKWRIEAHVDQGNTSSKNESLSKQRANAIVNYFIKKGLSASNFSVTYMGDKYPIDQNSTAYGRMKNRRIDIKRVQ